MEVCIYLYFLYLIYTAQCFYLIGNQKTLDGIIKARLSYATYFVQGKKGFIYRLDDDLGWSLGKNKKSGPYQTNRAGFRAIQEYSIIPDDDVLRIAAFGDSFVFCDDEKNTDTWPHFLQNSAKNLEVLNFGVSGYGFGQSYLRYLKDGLKFHPDIIFFNYIHIAARDMISPKDFAGLNNLRLAHFYRVRFWLQDGRLVSRSTTPYDLFDPDFRSKQLFDPLGIKENPGIWSWKVFSNTNIGLFIKNQLLPKYISELPYKNEPTGEQAEINEVIIRNLVATAVAQGSDVLFYHSQAFEGLPENIRNILNQYKDHVVYVDSRGRIDEQYQYRNFKNKQTLKNRSQHYNALGNELYAEAVLEVLKGRTWGKVSRTFRFNEETNSFQNVSAFNSELLDQ